MYKNPIRNSHLQTFHHACTYCMLPTIHKALDSDHYIPTLSVTFGPFAAEAGLV